MQDFYNLSNLSRDGIRLLEQQLHQLYKSNPVFILQDQIIGYWFDRWVMLGVKCYYWPAFVAGSADNIVDLFKPSTYSICR